MAKLLEPLQIGSMTLANRLVMPPMATAAADRQGLVSPALLDYYDAKTRSGCIGLVIVEHSYVHETGKASPIQLSAADDACIQGLRDLADTIHRNGSCAAMQLNHAGIAATEAVVDGQPAGPSAGPDPRRGKLCRSLTLEEIRTIIDSFEQAARRTKEAGFDAVEIHSAHGYLLNQFYSPLTNRRLDAYGGSIENRLRLHVQIIEAVRRQVGPQFPILMRLGAVDYMAGGSTQSDAVQAAVILAQAGLDVLDISGGFAGFDIPGLTGQGYFSQVSESIRQAAAVPVILTGGITDAFAAEQLLQDGKADLIGVGRAILKDDGWPQAAVDALTNRKTAD